jgi:sortase A
MYIIVLPVLPVVTFWWQRNHTDTAHRLATAIHAPVQADTVPRPNIPAGDRLVIPGMLLNEPVYQGRDMSTLNRGLWLRPQGSTPDKQKNTVIVGHRFTYTNPRGAFYSLDKVKIGDEIALYWHDVRYRYTVQNIAVVPANATEIEAPTDTARLTLYTCTPVWNPRDRLVVTAALEAVN